MVSKKNEIDEINNLNEKFKNNTFFFKLLNDDLEVTLRKFSTMKINN